MTTALTSAAVAAVVTLLVEYAAKPRLEVRKERILEVDRSRRRLVADMWQVASRLQVLLSLRVSPFDDVRPVLLDELENVQGDADRLRSELVRGRHSLSEDLAVVASGALGTITARCGQLESTLEGTLRVAKGATADIVIGPMAADLERAEWGLRTVAEVLEVGMLRIVKRVSAMREIRARAGDMRGQLLRGN